MRAISNPSPRPAFPRLSQRAGALASAFFIAMVPAIASAQNTGECARLEQERLRITQSMAHIIAEYPVTHLAIKACADSADAEYQRTKDRGSAMASFAICSFISCGLLGFDNCSTVATEWFRLYLQEKIIKDRLRELNCS